MSGNFVARRLRDECGVQFLGPVPTRAHHRRHGEFVDTFLVVEECRARGKVVLDEQVPWIWQGRRGLGIVLLSAPRDLARAGRLKVEIGEPCGHSSLLVSAVTRIGRRRAAKPGRPSP